MEDGRGNQLDLPRVRVRGDSEKRRTWTRPLALAFALALLCAPAHVVSQQDAPLPAFDPFVAEVKKRLQTDSALQSGYAFSERQTEQKLNGSGAVKEQHVKVFEVYPPLPGEEPYRRLIEEDGRPVPASELEKKDRDRRKKVEEYARDAAARTPSDREKTQREYEKALRERARDIDDIFNVFDVRMTGRESIDGHGTIAFSLTPRAGAKARTDSGKMMQHFTARAWISESEYELVRVEVEAIEPISFGLGILARLQPGATASFERRKVNGEVWLPARMTYQGGGRVLLLRKMRLAGSSDFFDYRRFSVVTETTIAAPADTSVN
jgi:hypothetical protein